MQRLLKTIEENVIQAVTFLGILQQETIYRFQAGRLGVRYLGGYEMYRLALFQDPVTGSSFAIREGEPLESGIERVRTRFGRG